MNNERVYKHGDKVLTIVQEPSLTETKESPIYEGRAEDAEGNVYRIIWQMSQCYIDNPNALDDEFNACDWDEYTVEEI